MSALFSRKSENTKSSAEKRRKMKKRQIGAMLMASLIGISVLSGCGAMPSTSKPEENKTEEVKEAVESGDSDEQITLRMVDWSNGVSEREEFNKKYMEEHPNIKIEYTPLTVDQFKNTIVTAIKSGDGPDLFPVPFGMTLTAAVNEGWYQPMNDYVTEEFKESFSPDAFAEGVTHIGDDWYTVLEQMPIAQCMFFYNKDVLENANVTKIPETYDEFREACKKITESGNGSVYGLIDGGKQVNRIDILTRTLAAAAGGKVPTYSKVLTVDGRAPYDSEEMKGAVGLLKELADDGSIHPDTVNISAPEAREMFAQGQAGFICQGMWCISGWGETYPDLEYGVMKVPAPEGTVNSYIPGDEQTPWMGIYKQSEHPKEAAEYLMALYSEEYGYQAKCVENGFFVSVIPEINEKYMTNEKMKEYYDLATESTKEIPSISKRNKKASEFYVTVQDVQPSLGNIVQGIFSKSITDYDTALNELADASTKEWQKACEEVGMDFSELEFSNWDISKDYTEEDYTELQ